MWGYLIITMIYAGTSYSVGLAWSPRYSNEFLCEAERKAYQATFPPWMKPGDALVATTRCQYWP